MTSDRPGGRPSRRPSGPIDAIDIYNQMVKMREVLEELLPFFEKAALNKDPIQKCVVFHPDTVDAVRRIREVL